MRHAHEHEIPVLIAGAGPAGLATAIALARQGVRCLVVERRRELSALPRATSISLRSMELLRAWGLEDQVRAGGNEVEWLMWECETLAQASAGSALQTGLPTREQSAVLSPTAPACVPQDHLERVMLDHLRSLGPARVELGTEVVGAEVRADGVRVALRDAGGGRSRVVHTRYLVAADGAHSSVRAALGIAMRGPDRLREAVSALFRAPLWDLVGDRRFGIYAVTQPEAVGSFLPAGPGDRWLYGVSWDPGQDDATRFTEEVLARQIALGAGVPGLRARIERTGAFTFAAQLADRFRQGSAFLVGDAAHRVTPRRGTGMNTAIHDGKDLGWKLAWVLRGWAGEMLLDSYEAERRPAVEHNVARSADPNGSIRDTTQELHTDLGGRLPHLWVPAQAGRMSTLDLLGPGLTLFASAGAGAARWAQAAAGVSAPAPPVAVRGLDAVTARALGIRGDGALLARPDGAPVGSWQHGATAAARLDAAVRSAAGDDGHLAAAA